jgi:hypothetical protein
MPMIWHHHFLKSKEDVRFNKIHLHHTTGIVTTARVCGKCSGLVPLCEQQKLPCSNRHFSTDMVTEVLTDTVNYE